MTDRPVSHTVSSVPASESFQRLIQFAKDMGSLTDLSLAAARVLAEVSVISRHDHGALFVIERERDRFCRQIAVGTRYSSQDLATIPISDPFVQRLASTEQTLYPHQDLHNNQAESDTKTSFADRHVGSAGLAIPLRIRNRLVAFILLAPVADVDAIEPDLGEGLSALAQIAANALDAILVRNDLAHSQTLMRRTDRLRSLEIIAGGFAHEIRNPLTSIKTFIQLAPERKNDAEFILDFSRIVLEDVNRIERLIQEILDYARYMEPKLTEEDLNEIMSSCLYFIQVKAESRGIKIEKELASGLPRVMLDRQQTKQVLLNLLLNAMDAMGERGGFLRVRTSRFSDPNGKPWVRSEIEDTGHGIPPANLEHIFDPFFTTKHSGEEREGTGLGLTIAHQIIKEHLGTLHVTSTEGVGTMFVVNLPALS